MQLGDDSVMKVTERLQTGFKSTVGTATALQPPSRFTKTAPESGDAVISGESQFVAAPSLPPWPIMSYSRKGN